MKRKLHPTVCRNAKELAEAIGLDPCHAIEWELRSSVTHKIIGSFQKEGQTITHIANKAQTSRARVTRILKGDSHGISLDVLFKVLAAVGQRIQISYKKAA